MGESDTTFFEDYEGRQIRLTAERRAHLLEHPEMVDQFELVRETVITPEFVIATIAGESVHVYHRHYTTTPVTSKYLLVAVKILDNDRFMLTAFFSSRPKKGTRIWPT